MPTYLTRRQKEILDFIREFQTEQGIAPTLLEIRRRFGYSSYGTVHKHLRLLQEKGYLKRHWNQKRGLELTESGSESGAAGTAGLATELPFFGRIAAGQPIEALAGNETVGVPGHLLGNRAGEHYVLKVVGESMIEEGIHEGDLVVVMRREEAERGDMVVALVGTEATLKRFYPEGDTIRLQPANRRMKPIRVPASELTIQGIVVGLMRRF